MSDHPTNFEASLSAINSRVSTKMNEELVSKFKPYEIRAALKQMHPTKSSGPDSMSPIFYQKY